MRNQQKQVLSNEAPVKSMPTEANTQEGENQIRVRPQDVID